MTTFETGVVILWTLPLLGLGYLILRFLWEQWRDELARIDGERRLAELVAERAAREAEDVLYVPEEWCA